MGEKIMIQYVIQYTKAADKFLKDHESLRTQYENALRELIAGDHPETVDVKRIQGKRSTYYRIRLGNYRIVYTIIHNKIVVVCTLLAGPRGDVYKKMQGLK